MVQIVLQHSQSRKAFAALIWPRVAVPPRGRYYKSFCRLSRKIRKRVWELFPFRLV